MNSPRHGMFLVTLLLPAASCHSLNAAEPRVVTNSVGMRFAWITAEENAGELDLNGRRSTPVLENSGYYLGTCEVTQSQFGQVMKRNPSQFSRAGRLRERIQGGNTDDHPVDSVSWYDAREFCKRLSQFPREQQSGRAYRLPTVAEWEFAARAGAETTWCFGDDSKLLDKYAWFGFEQSNHSTHRVGQKKPNAFGLFDMYGNVWEWCQDADPRESEGSERPARVIRGGGWSSEARRCTSSYWRSDPSMIGDPDSGFRVIMERE